jgi:hypothetical protein
VSPFVLLYRRIVDSDDLYGPMEVDDDLSTALDTKTLIDRDVLRHGLDDTAGSSVETLPIISAECEGIFSSTKKLTILERNALVDGAIKAWWDQGLIIGQRDI